MFIGYYVACCFIIVFATISGIMSSYLTFALGKQKEPTAIRVGIGITFFVIFTICSYWLYLPNDYYRYAGNFDYYRMPLDYPYELSMIDSLDCAYISTWQEDIILVEGVTHYRKRDNIIVGKISKECFDNHEYLWFSFDTKTGRVVRYDSEKEFQKTLKMLGFDEELKLLTIQENWDLYW